MDESLNLSDGQIPKPKETLIDKIKLRIPSFSFVHTVLIPLTVVVLVLLVGGGGTYLLASSALQATPPPSQSVSSISEADIAVPTTIPTILPTATPTPTSIPQTASISATPTPSVAANWIPYNFSPLFLNFSYPPGWFVNVANTSGPPYLYVQNFSGPIPIDYAPDQYAILVARLEQVGITTVEQLTSQLAQNDVNNTYINGQNMGQVTVISSNPTTVNGFQALEQTVSFSSSPSAQFYQLYVLDGVSNVVEFMPLLNTTYGQPYFNTLISTIDFTN